MAVKPRPSASRSTRAQSATRKAGTKRVVPNAELIPPESILDSYISRMVTSDLTEFEIFDFGMSDKKNILIEGPTGPGKTTAVRAYAAYKQVPFYAIPSNVGIDPSQLFGKMIVKEDRGLAWIDGPVTKLVRHGGVLLINEINFLPERLSTVLFGLLDGRRQISLLEHEGEVIDAHPDLLVVADMNPDYEGTRPLNKALRNRFAIQMFWDYDPRVESKLVPSPELLKMAQQLRVAQQAGTYETPCSTNMLMEFVDIFHRFGFEFAKLNFTNHYPVDERAAASTVVDTYKLNIENDLKNARKNARKKKVELADLDDLRAELEELLDPDLNQWIEEGKDEDGNPTWNLVDSKDGVYGVDWVYGDEDDDEKED